MPYFLSDDTAANPDFHDWNHVDIPYCSQVGGILLTERAGGCRVHATDVEVLPPASLLQDLHSGTVTEPSNSTWGLYFSGHLIVEAVLNALEASAGLGSATGEEAASAAS